MTQPPAAWLGPTAPPAGLIAAFSALGRGLDLVDAAGLPPAAAGALRLCVAPWGRVPPTAPQRHPCVWLRPGPAPEAPPPGGAWLDWDPDAADPPSARGLARALHRAMRAASTAAAAEGAALLAAGLAANQLEPWGYDPCGRVLSLGPLLAARLGRGAAPVELDDDDMLQHIVPEDRDVARGLLVAATAAPGPVRVRLRLQVPGGPPAPVELRGQAIAPPPGQACGPLLGVWQDLSAWSALEEQRAQVSRRWAAAGGMRPGFLWEVDADGRFTWVSPRAAEVVGWDPAALLGRPLSALLADPGPAADLLATALRGEPAQAIRARLLRQDGAVEQALLGAEAAPDPLRGRRRVAGTAVLVGGIGAELAQLEAEQRAVLGEAQQKASFVANLSHEIRTPLSGLVGLSELVLEEPLAPGPHGQLLTVRAQARRLLGVVDKVLELARMEAGRAAPEPAAVSPAALLDAALRPLVGVGLSAARLRAGPTPARWRVWADPGLLQQLLRHLIGLAVATAGPAGPVEVQLGPGADGQGLELRVAAPGADALAAALALSFSSPAAIAAEGSDRQVDVALCRHLLRAVDGVCLGVPGAPPRLHVSLPLHRVPDAPAVDPGALRSVALILPPGPDVEHLHALLQAQGVEVHRYSGAAEALSGLARLGWSPGAVVVGLALAPVDGLSLLRVLSAQPALAHAGLFLAPLGAGAERLAALSGLPRVTVLEEPWVEGSLVPALRLRPLDHDPAPRAGLRGRTALLVEDHPVNQEVLKALLGRLGVEVEVCADGQAALSALSQRGYDLALMDCHLPLLDGLAVTRLLRARERQLRGPRQLILALTASDLAADRLACRAAGMDGYLLKPISLSELSAGLERALGLRPAEGQ